MKIEKISNSDIIFRSTKVTCDNCGSVLSLEDSDKLHIINEKYSLKGVQHFMEISPLTLMMYTNIFDSSNLLLSEIYSAIPFVLPSNTPKGTDLLKDLNEIYSVQRNLYFVCPNEKISVLTNEYCCPICGGKTFKSVTNVPYLVGMIEPVIDGSISIGTWFSKRYQDEEKNSFELNIIYKGEGIVVEPKVSKLFKKLGYTKHDSKKENSTFLCKLLSL